MTAPYTITCPVYAAPRPTPAPVPVRRATYDAAQTAAENRAHWQNADDLSANAAADPDVRRTLRKRARYERDNDPHLNGLTKTLAYDLVGTGPRLQLLLGEEYEADARLVEKSFADWCRAADAADKLRVLHEARPVDGESFGLLTTNDLLANPVKLDLRTIEADQIETPPAALAELENAVSGIEFDRFGNPAYYHLLRQHPGDAAWWDWAGEYDRVPARNIVHWFRPSRPGQARGVSELAASLPLSSQTRRYSAAVLSAAEFAASIAGVMQSNLPPADGPVAVDSMDYIDTPRGKLLTLPEGWQANQFKAEQPTGTHNEFVDGKRADQGRPVLAPRNVMLGNSSQYNYSSGRLDHVPYHRSVWIERERFRTRVIDRVFLAWYAEARLIGLIPDALPPVNLWVWDWHWDGFESIDPVKDASASQLRLALNLTTLSEECAGDGKNWRDVVDQRAREFEYMRAKGVPTPVLPASELPEADPKATPEVAPAEDTAGA